MFKYGTRSKEELATCHPALRLIAAVALEYSPYDIAIIHGLRDKETQNKLVDEGASKLRFPHSRHNQTRDPAIDPFTISDALDFTPWIKGSIHWNDTHMFAVIAGCFMSAAISLGYVLRWGGDWDSDGETVDQTFMDWGHVEIDWERTSAD